MCMESTLRCLIKGGLEIFVKFNKQRGQNKWGAGISKNLLISVINEKRDINI